LTNRERAGENLPVPKFIIRFPSGGETSFQAEENDIFIGRIPSINDICINDPSVSRQHAHIKRREEGYAIYDLKSLNGVLLNGRKVTKAVLRDGDEIRLGDVRVEVRIKERTEEEVLESIEQSESTQAEYAERQRSEPTRPGVTYEQVKKTLKKKR
jgi:pSer/pThr/pTyr-binding forkhead associated (FHA) protein